MVVDGDLMATIAMIDGPKRLLYPTHNGIVVSEKFSDKCSRCQHSRADHLVLGATTIDAVTDCNRCGKYPADWGYGTEEDKANRGQEDPDLANTPLCVRFA